MARYFRSWLGRSEVVAARKPDPWLWLPATALLILGAMMVLNTTYFMQLGKTGDGFHLLGLHLCHIALGALVLVFFSQLSLKGLGRLATPLMMLSAGLLLAIWLPGMGVVRGGARRWLRLGPVLLEPSEVFKLALVLFLARFLARRGERVQSFKSGPLIVFAIVAPMALSVLKQPDFGATVMIALLVFVMLYAAGARASHLAWTGACAALLLGIQALARSYRVRRLTAFLHPWRTARGAGFQLIQSLIAIAAGGGWGVGLGAGYQKMFYLPQAHTDFIFAVIGEDLGIAGAVAVIALFCVIMWRGMRIAREEPDPFASLLAAGLSALIALQALVNIAVVIGMAPTKGLPLPFVSYGGTATVMAMADLGILLALGRRPAVR